MSQREKIIDVVQSLGAFEGMDVTRAEIDWDSYSYGALLTVEVDGQTYTRPVKAPRGDPQGAAFPIVKGFSDIGHRHRGANGA